MPLDRSLNSQPFSMPAFRRNPRPFRHAVLWTRFGGNEARDVGGNEAVDGWNPAFTRRLVVYPIIYRVLCIPGGGLGFLNHQQYEFIITIEKKHMNFQKKNKTIWKEMK